MTNKNAGRNFSAYVGRNFSCATKAMFRVVAAAIALAAPSSAMAQDAPAQVNQGGPMTVEVVMQRYVVAPEIRVVKVSSLDRTTGVLVGGHGGLLLGSRLLVGGGLYTLANGSRGEGLTYGGGVVGWQWWNGHMFSSTIRGLVGMGQGTTSQSLTLTDREGRSFTEGRRLSSDFFVAEPQADLLVRLTRHLQLDVGAGYRATSAEHGVNDRFSGATGSLALRIGPVN
jgi:hypothetical protein